MKETTKQQLTTKDYDNLIKGVVINYIKGLGKPDVFANVDDWVQESWLAILEWQADPEKGNGDMPDLGLAKKIIKDKCTDLTRKAEHRNHDWYDETEDEESDAFVVADTSVRPSMIDDITAHELLALFPEGTPENDYVKYWLEDANWKNFGFNPDAQSSKRNPDTDMLNARYTQKWIAQKLGFVPGGTKWRNWRDKVNAQIAKVIKDNMD